MDEELSIRIKAQLDSGVKRALAGVTNEAKKADKEITASNKSANKERFKAVEQYVSSVRRAENTAKRESMSRGREILQDFRKNEKAKREELARTLRETQMSERRRAQIIQRTEREIARERGAARAGARDALSGGAISGARNRRRQIIGATGGALLGAAGGAISAMSSAQSTLGIQSQEQIVAATIQAQQSFIMAASQANMSQEQQTQLMRQIVDDARAASVSPIEIMEGVVLSQELFSNMNELSPNLRFLARLAHATGSEFAGIIAVSGELGRQWEILPEHMEEAMNFMAQAATAGSLSVPDFANEMAPTFAPFRTARGVSGVEGLREIAAVAQSLKASGVASAEVPTLLKNLLTKLSDPNAQQSLRDAGIEVLNENGNVRNISEIVNEMSSSRSLQTRDGGISSTALRRLIVDQQATDALTTLIQQERDGINGNNGAMRLADREGALAADGAAGVDRAFNNMTNSASGRAIAMRVDREASVVENADAMIDAFASVAGPLTGLQNEFPLLTQAVSGLTSVIGGAGAGGVGGGFLASMFGAGTGGAVASGGSGLFGAFGGLSAAALGTGALAAGGTAAALTMDTPEGGDVIDFWSDVMRGVPMAQAGQRPEESAINRELRNGGVDQENTRATEENNRMIREHSQALRENTAATRASSQRPPDTGTDTGVQ